MEGFVITYLINTSKRMQIYLIYKKNNIGAFIRVSTNIYKEYYIISSMKKKINKSKDIIAWILLGMGIIVFCIIIVLFILKLLNLN